MRTASGIGARKRYSIDVILAIALVIDMRTVAVRSSRKLDKQVWGVVKVADEIDNCIHMLRARHGRISGKTPTAHAMSGRNMCEICRQNRIIDRYLLGSTSATASFGKSTAGVIGMVRRYNP